MYRGRKQLGQEIVLGVQCTDSNGSPVAPDAAPTMKIYSQTGTLYANRQIPAQDKARIPGLFADKEFLNSTFAVGQFTAVYTWAVATVKFSATDDFEILPGGNAGGEFISLHFHQGTQDNFVTGQTNAGYIPRYRNPILN